MVSKIGQVTYSDFVLNTTIDPEQFDKNFDDVCKKIDAVIDEIIAIEAKKVGTVDIDDGAVTIAKLDPAIPAGTVATALLDANKMDKAGGTFTGAVVMGRNSILQPKLKDYSETLATNATATGAVNIDLALGNVHNITLTGDTTLSFINLPPATHACSLTLIVNQGATPKALTFPASVKFSNDVIPVISDASKTSLFTFVTTNGGTRWYGAAATKFTT